MLRVVWQSSCSSTLKIIRTADKCQTKLYRQLHNHLIEHLLYSTVSAWTKNCLLSGQYLFISTPSQKKWKHAKSWGYESRGREGRREGVKEGWDANYHWKMSAQVSINQIFSFTFMKCFQWLVMVALQIQTPAERDRPRRSGRSPADWKHLGDCREHSHIIQRWLRFDSALWSDSFDLSQCACVQLPETGVWLEKRTEPDALGAGWYRCFWWELCWQPTFQSQENATSLLMRLVPRRRESTQQLFRIFGARCWDVCHNRFFYMINCKMFSFLGKRKSKDTLRDHCV